MTRLSKLIKALETFEVECIKPKRGSHWKFRRAGCRSYPVPAHKGAQSRIPPEYINGLCRCMAIDPEALRKLL